MTEHASLHASGMSSRLHESCRFAWTALHLDACVQVLLHSVCLASAAHVVQDPGKGGSFVPGKRKGPKNAAKPVEQQLAAEGSAHSLAQGPALTDDAL